MPKVTVKHGSTKYENVEIDPALPVRAFRDTLLKLTGVPVARQKLMAKGVWKGMLKDSVDLSTLSIADGALVTLMGAADKVAARPTEEVKFVEDMTSKEVAEAGAVVPAGIVNEGNTCYMNSTLECFRHVPEIRSALKEWDGSGGMDGTVAVAAELRGLMGELDSSVEPVRPLRFLARLRQAFPQFGETDGRGIPKQQDAEEFQNVLMTCLGNALTKPSPSVPSLGDRGNALDAVLGFKVRVTMTCQETDAEPPSVRSEGQRKLVCNIEGGAGAKNQINDLSEGVKLNLRGSLTKRSEVLGRDAEWVVDRRLESLPRVLAVQFMRFYWKPTPDSRDRAGVKCKMMRPVSFPTHNFDVRDFCTPEVQARLAVERTKARDEEERLLAKAEAAGGKKAEGDGEGGAGAGAGADAEMEEDDDDAEMKAAMALSMGEGGAAGGAGGAGDADMGAALEGPVGIGLPEHFRGYYELAGVVTHKGRSADSGHYMGWVRQKGDDWLCFDDDEVSQCKTEDIAVLKGGGDYHMAYLCFYRAQTATVAEEAVQRAAAAEASLKAKKK
uniref:ubiquitinyl hydrolase 1 n=1 Tax=Bicosoecida sp. CB-2014 TaxID=1486930 RepID=A0A7S1CA16_9STRA|mmetsp:Transcript_19006/g.67115  ORF Transcript_19006/g.67115 Transcript_19006/m.67115 type:complete len:556 (+) Transcript_19006:197-1864(+)